MSGVSMNKQNNWGRRVGDEQMKSSVGGLTRHVNQRPRMLVSKVLGDTEPITRLQTMFFKVTQTKRTIGIESSHIYGATGGIQLAPDDVWKYQALMNVLKDRKIEGNPICVAGWCRIERDSINKGLVIIVEAEQLSTGTLCFGPREMEALQIRALIKTMGAVQMIRNEMCSVVSDQANRV